MLQDPGLKIEELPREEAHLLLCRLEAMEWPEQARAAVSGRGSCLGVTNGPRGTYLIPSTPQRIGVLAAIQKLVQKVELAKDLEYSSAQVNRWSASAKHRDRNNLGPSLILGLGDYKWGELLVKRENGAGDFKIDIQWKICAFSGFRVHASMEFESNRWTIVLFTHSGSGELKAADKKLLANLHFPMGSPAANAPEARNVVAAKGPRPNWLVLVTAAATVVAAAYAIPPQIQLRWKQEQLKSSFLKLFPVAMVADLQFPWSENLLNKSPFTDFEEYLARESGSPLANQGASWRVLCTGETRQQRRSSIAGRWHRHKRWNRW
jgi:hypothetical protein